MGRGNHLHNGQKAVIYRVRKNERKNRATTMTKAQAQIERGAIRQGQNTIDAIPPAPGATDAFPLGRNVSGETRPVRNAVGAIELEPNGFVQEHELALDCVVVVRQLHSAVRHRVGARRDSAAIAPGQRPWADVAEPTRRTARVFGAGEYPIGFHLRGLPFAESRYGNPDCKTAKADENSRTADYLAELRLCENLGAAQSRPANSMAQCVLCFVGSEQAQAPSPFGEDDRSR
jgi:hypothetical protein